MTLLLALHTSKLIFIGFVFPRQGHFVPLYCDRRASQYWTSIRRWISMGFTPSLLKKRITERCSSLVHVASGAATLTLLLRRRVAFLHRTAICRPLFKPWVSFLSTYRQSSCVLNFYRTFKVSIWLSLANKKFSSRYGGRCLQYKHYVQAVH